MQLKKIKACDKGELLADIKIYQLMQLDIHYRLLCVFLKSLATSI